MDRLATKILIGMLSAVSYAGWYAVCLVLWRRITGVEHEPNNVNVACLVVSMIPAVAMGVALLIRPSVWVIRFVFALASVGLLGCLWVYSLYQPQFGETLLIILPAGACLVIVVMTATTLARARRIKTP